MTIYDDIGGAGRVAAVVDDFYERVLAFQQLARWFDGIDVRRLKAHQRAFIAATIGGPDGYTGRSMPTPTPACASPGAFTRVVDHWWSRWLPPASGRGHQHRRRPRPARGT